MKTAPFLESERLIYKPVSRVHLSNEYVSWLNDPEVYQYLETGGDYTLAMLESFIEDVEKKDILFWGIHLKDTQKHIGNIKIDPVNHRHGLAEYGIMMGDRMEWGKGYANEASKRIIDYCFKEVNIRKITLGVVEDNVAAVKLYKKLGFEIEGIYKKHGFYQNKLCNTIRMALFNPNYKKS